MKAYIIKDSNGNIYGYERDGDNKSFSKDNAIFILFANRDWAMEFGEIFNTKPMLNLATPITVLEILIPV